jgi:hypothetical protein
MSENTEVRQKKAWKEWFAKNGFAAIMGLLVAMISSLSAHVWNTMAELQESMQRMEAKVEVQSDLEMKSMWSIIRSREEQLTEHEIQIRLHDRLIGLRAAEELEVTGMTYEDLLDAVREVMKEDDTLYDYKAEEMFKQQMLEKFEFDGGK